MSALQLQAIESVSRDTALPFLTPAIRRLYEAVPEEVKALNELQLAERFDSTTTDYVLRKRLWELIAESQITGEHVSPSEWIADLCTRPTLYSRLEQNQFRLCWILLPPEDPKLAYHEMFDIMLRKFREKIKNMSINDDNFGDALRLMENLANRVLGPVAKNINLKTQSIPAPQPPPQNPQEVEARIKELEQLKLSQAKPVGPELPE